MYLILYGSASLAAITSQPLFKKHCHTFLSDVYVVVLLDGRFHLNGLTPTRGLCRLELNTHTLYDI